MVFILILENVEFGFILDYSIWKIPKFYLQATTEEQRVPDVCHHCEHRAAREATVVVHGSAHASAHGSRNGTASVALNGYTSGATSATLMLGGLSGGGILDRVRTLLDEQALAMRRLFERVDGLGAGFVSGADFRKTLFQFGIPIGVIELDFLLTRYTNTRRWIK